MLSVHDENGNNGRCRKRDGSIATHDQEEASIEFFSHSSTTDVDVVATAADARSEGGDANQPFDDTDDVKELTAAETARVGWGRAAVLFSIIIAASLVCSGAHWMLSAEEADDYETYVSVRARFSTKQLTIQKIFALNHQMFCFLLHSIPSCVCGKVSILSRYHL
jgi:hypothetical protein